MKKALFLYRFHCMEPASSHTWKQSYSIIPGIFVHVLERVRDFRDTNNIPVEFVCIADNTTETLLPRTEKMMYDILGKEGCSFIVTTTEEDIFHPAVPNYPIRKMRDGTLTGNFTHAEFTFFVTSMEEINLRKDEDMIVFFCESDYVYREDALLKGYQMACKYEDDFVTLYEHPGIYLFPFDQLKPHHVNYEQREVNEFGHKWITAVSTCLTFIGSMKAIKKFPVLFLECRVNWHDQGLWRGIMNAMTDSPSQLWTPVPTLNYHFCSCNVDNPEWNDYWVKLIHSLIVKNY